MTLPPVKSVLAQTTGLKTQKTSKYDAMIETLANRSPQPLLVKLGHRTVPLYADNYDWEEERRVKSALGTLLGDDSPELWEQLVKHVHDRSYALTMRDNGPNARNYSAGDLCELIAWARFSFVERWHSDPNDSDRPDIHLDIGIDNIVKWRAERAEMSLYELQIELCQRALEAVDTAKEEEVPEQAKPRIRKQLQAWIDELQKTKRPFFFRMTMDGFDNFDPKEAKALRKKIGQKP